MGGEGMIIGNEEIAVVFVLHLQEILQCPEIISEMEVACAADAAYYDFFLCLCHFDGCESTTLKS